jgi:TRAP transporter TAXI family solute receptor
MWRPILAALGVCLATACSGSAESTGASGPVTLRLAKNTANDLRDALARHPEIQVKVVSEGGSSIASLLDLRNGKVDITTPVADVAYLAYAGQLGEMPGTFEQLRGLAVIDLIALHLLIGPSVRAHTLRDLEGLRVSVGAPASSSALITERMLNAHGVLAGEYRSSRLPNAEMVRQLVGGQIDAAFSMFVPVNQAVSGATQAGARLIDIEGPIVEEFRTHYPYLKRTLIPAGTYPNQPQPIRTIGVDVVMVCRADLDEDVVYRLLDAYFATRPAMTPPNLERAPATPIPLHTGAARYYRQRELAR